MLNLPIEVSTRSVSSSDSDAFLRMNSDEDVSQPHSMQSSLGESSSATSSYFLSPENFIWYEISMVEEVESVFIEREGDYFNVLTVVNEHDEQLRERIYDREASVINSLPMYSFDFHVLPRMGHPEQELVNRTKAYRRR